MEGEPTVDLSIWGFPTIPHTLKGMVVVEERTGRESIGYWPDNLVVLLSFLACWLCPHERYRYVATLIHSLFLFELRVGARKGRCAFL